MIHFDSITLARKAGQVAGELSQAKAERRCPEFSDKAFAYIASFARAAQKPFTGESLTDNMKALGIRPHDDRAFGPVFARAIRAGLIKTVGFVPRKKGHGTAGGRLYASGSHV
jgi:hypothetical protein